MTSSVKKEKTIEDVIEEIQDLKDLIFRLSLFGLLFFIILITFILFF